MDGGGLECTAESKATMREILRASGRRRPGRAVAQIFNLLDRGFSIRTPSVIRPACRLQVGDTAPRGTAANAGARVSDPQRPGEEERLRISARPSGIRTCCGSESRPPRFSRSPRRFQAILIDCKSALRTGPSPSFRAGAFGLALVVVGLLLSSCGQKPAGAPATANDPHLTPHGTVELTAKLVEIPEGAIFKRDLYDCATILKYQMVKVHRGQVATNTLFVGHYNPWKPRAEAADKRVQGVGGTLKQFRAGDTHRMALEVPIDDHFMGGIVNKYFGKDTGPLYWAVWTNQE